MLQFAYRVTILVHSLNPGGAQKRLITIANGLARRGAAVRFVAVNRQGEGGDELDPSVGKSALKAARRKPWQTYFNHGLRELNRELGANPPDVLLAGTTTVHGLAVVAARSLPADRRPRVVLRASRHPVRDVSRRGLVSRVLEPVRRLVHRRVYAKADLIIAVADDVADAINCHLPPSTRLVVLDNPVVNDEFVEALNQRPGHAWASPERDQPLLISVARLTPQKGIDVLLTAFATLVARRPARLIVLGDGRRRGELEELRARLGLDGSVDLPGFKSSAAPWLANADLLVSSSRYEGASAVLVEGLCAGLPMVVTDCPGNSRSLVEQTGAGLVVPVDDPVALAKAMDQALDQQWDRDHIRVCAERYRVGRAVDAYHHALLSLVASRQTPPLAGDRATR